MARVKLKSKKLLIVDDDPVTRGVMHQVAINSGIKKVETAADGSEAIDAVGAFQPDAVLCDIMMKPMDGLEFLKLVRLGQHDLPRDLRVIMFTAGNKRAHYGTALALDADGFLEKPVEMETLKARLERVFTEEPVIRSIEAYEVIPLPGKTAPAREPAGEPLNGIAKTIPKLVAGDIVASDLTLSDGTLLLAAGVKISQRLLDRLIDLHECKLVGTIQVEG